MAADRRNCIPLPLDKGWLRRGEKNSFRFGCGQSSLPTKPSEQTSPLRAQTARHRGKIEALRALIKRQTLRRCDTPNFWTKWEKKERKKEPRSFTNEKR